MSLRVSIIVHDMSDGAVARAEALHNALVALGHRPRTLSTHGERGVWLPLARSEYARTCSIVPAAEVGAVVAEGTDLLLAVKPLPSSLGLAMGLARQHRLPLLADVDDPDVEVRSLWLPRRVLARRLRRDPRAIARLLALRNAARRLPTTVSNPVLQRMYGGELVPHARRDRGAGAPHTSDRPWLAFVGTARSHKGIDLLRQAAERLAPEGWTLVVTDYAPVDPRPWESWMGPEVPDSHGLLCRSDVVAIPSTDDGRGRAQLPMKLVDAMQAGRGVVVSDAGPLAWAAGPHVPTFPAGDVDGLVAALRPLRDPVVRARVGAVAREQALARFSPEAVAPALQRGIDAALRHQRGHRVPAPRAEADPGLRLPAPVTDPVGREQPRA